MKNVTQAAGIYGKWRWLLGISLALNLLVIGTVLGAAWRHAGPGGDLRHRGGSAGFATPFLRALPDEARTEIRATLQTGSQDRRDFRKIRRAHYAEVAKVLQAEPFEPAALQALLAAHQTTGLARQKSLQDAWVTVVQDMEPQARQAYATRLLEVVDRPRRRKRGRD